MKRLFLYFLLCAPACAQFLNGYNYQRKIVIDHTKVPNTDQSNFPVLITGCYSTLATVANGGHVQSSSAYDILFTSDAAGGSPLNWEVEPGSYNPATGCANFWVQIPTLSHTTDTTFYLWYGNGSSNSFQSPSSAWDSTYKAVLHMGDQSAGTTVTDSTANHNNLTNQASTASRTTAGIIGNALTYNGTSDYSSGVNPVSSGPYTTSMWVQPITPKHMAGAASVGNDPVTDNGSTWEFWQLNGCGSSCIGAYNGSQGTFGLTAFPTGSWYHLAITSDGGTQKFYVNGALAGTQPFAAGHANNFYVATGYNLMANELVDEVHQSNVARSADWLLAEFNNQFSPSTFYTVSGENVSSPSVTCAPAGTVSMLNFPYNAAFVVAGGTPPFTFSITNGSLPPGLVINPSSGVVAGTPTTTTGSPFAYTVNVVDAATHTGSASCSTAVVPTGGYAPRVLYSSGDRGMGSDISGPTTVLSGHTNSWAFAARWTYPVYASVATQKFNSGGTHTPSNGDQVRLLSTGNMPGGLWNYYGGTQAPFMVCNYNASNGDFTLNRAPQGCIADLSGTVNTSGTTVTLVSGDNFQSYMTGGASIFQGGNSIVINGTSYTVQGFTDASHITLTTTAGNQTGVAYSYAQHPPFTDSGTGILYVTGPNNGFGTGYSVYSVSGGPPGTTFYWWYLPTIQLRIPQGNAPFTASNAYLQLDAAIPAGAAPGNAPPITVILAQDNTGANPTTITIPVTVQPYAPVSLGSDPPSFPPLPGLSTWQANMTAGTLGDGGSGPGSWCDPSTGNLFPADFATYGSFNEQYVWYYDGMWVYYNIADYTQNPGWKKCSYNIALKYARDTLLLRSRGNTQRNAIEMYARGPLLNYTSGDRRFVALVDYQTTYNVFVWNGQPQGPGANYCGSIFSPINAGGGTRELALTLDQMLDKYELIGAPMDRCVADWAHQLLFVLQTQVDGTYGGGMQPFINGFVYHSLRHYWSLTHDPLVPIYIKNNIDYLYSFYNASSGIHSWPYNTNNDGVGCACAGGVCPHDTWWFMANGQTVNCLSDLTKPGGTVDVLNNLINHIYPWYGRVSGDQSYLTKGDDSFANVFAPGWGSTGKLSNQVYRLSFDYVCLRTGTCSP